jgi:hypothetical protein
MTDKNKPLPMHPIQRWFLTQILDHPARTIVISLIATAILGFGIKWVIIEDDLMKMLPKKLHSRVVWDEVREEFGNTQMIFVAFGHKGEDALNQKTLASLWDVTRALEDLPAVDEVISIASQNRLDSEDGFMEVNDLQPERVLSPEEIQDLMTYLDKTPDMKVRLISRHGDYFNIAVRPNLKVGNDVVTSAVVTTVDSVLKGYDVHFGGQTYITGKVPGLIREDVLILMRIGLVIMIAILLINLRSLAGVGMVLSVILLSLVAMMGFMGWVVHLTGSEKFLFTMLNSSMPIILLTIANSDGVHVLTKFFRLLRIEKNPRQALERTMDSLLLPIFLTSFTTVAAFLSMIFAPLEQLAGYGLSLVAGITWAWLLSSTFLPAMIHLKKWNQQSKAITHDSLFERAIYRLGNVVISHPKRVLGTGLVVVGIASVGIFQVHVNANIVDFFKPGSEIRDSMDFLDQELTGTVDLEFKLTGDLKSPAVLKDVAAIETFVETNPHITTAFSIVDIIEKMHRVVMDDDPRYEVIPDTREKVNNLFTLYSMSGDPDDFSALVDYDYENGLITALSRTMSTDEIIKSVNDIQGFVDQNVKSDLQVEVTGMLVVLRDVVFSIVHSSFISIFVSILMIGLIASYFFRRITWGILAVAPLTAAVILNFGFMGIFNIDLSHITAILSSIIIGVGVDFAIHYISQYRRMVKRQVPAAKLSREVVKEVGYPIVLDAASNMGFGALLFSSFLPIEYIGGLMVFAMISTSMGTLTLLAALAEIKKKHLIKISAWDGGS